MRKILVLLPIALLVAACSSGASSPSAAATQAPVTPAATASTAADTAEPSATGGEVTIQAAESDLGEILVDADGRTLYAFTKDTDGTSTCYDQCATNWPPLIAGDELSVGEGLDDSDLATTDRTDGSKQVTYFGKPLYYFAADAAAGDTSGQGVGGIWYVVAPDGQLIQ